MALLRNDRHTLTGVYALDALDTAAEVTRFERHLNRCDSCTSEVRGFRETATRLAMAVAQQPPPGLRTAVMADVARTRQAPAADERARHARPVPRPTLLPRLAMAGAALGLAAAVILGVVLVNTNNQLSQTQQQLSQAQRHLILAQTQLAAINAVRTACRCDPRDQGHLDRRPGDRSEVGGQAPARGDDVGAAAADSRQGLPALADRCARQQDPVGGPAGRCITAAPDRC